MSTHIRVLGWLYIVLGIFGILIACTVTAIIAGGGFISGDQTAINITLVVGLIVGAFVIIPSVPGIFVGAGLLGFRPWARIGALVLAVLNLPAFPTGTVLGIYSLYVLLDDESSRLFNS